MAFDLNKEIHLFGSKKKKDADASQAPASAASQDTTSHMKLTSKGPVLLNADGDTNVLATSAKAEPAAQSKAAGNKKGLLGKELSLESLFGFAKSEKDVEWPSKTTMNLYTPRDRRRLKSKRSTPQAIVQILLALVAVGLLLKFGVFDMYAKLGAKQAELERVTSQISDAEQTLAEYNSVLDTYEMYHSTSSTLAMDATSTLDMVESLVMTVADVTKIEMEKDTLKLTLSNVSLDELGQLSATLSQQSGVSKVGVSTAARTDGSSTTSATTTAELTVTFVDLNGTTTDETSSQTTTS